MTTLRGTEELTLEVGASLDEAFARAAVPARLELEAEGGRARAGLLLFRMSGLRWRELPPSFDYMEALWRISVRSGGELAWYAVACDIDHPVVRFLGARVVRYPTRAAKLMASEARWKDATNDAALELDISDVEPGVVPSLRRTFVSSYEIPWTEQPPNRARSVRVKVKEDALLRATFGEDAKLDEMGVVHRGRIHMCDAAKKVR
jgi:hypothetical protein